MQMGHASDGLLRVRASEVCSLTAKALGSSPLPSDLTLGVCCSSAVTRHCIYTLGAGAK